jgi:ferredoxin-NADP reductase
VGPGLDDLRRRVVLGKREVSPGVFLLSFEGEPDFLPGQNVNLTVEPAVPARPYSLASAPGDPDMEVLFDLVPLGMLTPRLAALESGDPLYVSRAFGGFRDDERPATWIAAGTGVAPFASMVRSGLTRDKILVHGSRSPDGLHFRELFASRLGPRYIPWHGGLASWVRESALATERRYLLCGSTPMVLEVRDLLMARGVPFENIVAEIYF